MKWFKLKIGLGLIPFFGFVIDLFWGMFSVYKVNRKSSQVFFYDFVAMIGMFIVFIPMGLGIYLFTQYADLTNITLVVGVELSIVFVGLYLMTAVCLAVQYLYCKKLVANKNAQNLS
ncbi:MAG: hypothetical protein K2O28_05615 [Clostridia bacterium]|nr:hypothetical protein [Clostridia bacterium]